MSRLKNFLVKAKFAGKLMPYALCLMPLLAHASDGIRTIDDYGTPHWDDSINHYELTDWTDAPDQIIEGEFFHLLQPRQPIVKWSESEYCHDFNWHLQQRFPGCPFDTLTECEIWKTKPYVNETIANRSPNITIAAVKAIAEDVKISANAPAAAPLLNRYRDLQAAARACCVDGMAYELKRTGASDGLIYKYMTDDANFYQFGDRCLMMTDAELDKKYPTAQSAETIADVRNGCLCRRRQWFADLLAPFQQVYEAAPEFKKQKFFYEYTDGLQRKITTSVNNDVQNVLSQLSKCP